MKARLFSLLILSALFSILILRCSGPYCPPKEIKPVINNRLPVSSEIQTWTPQNGILSTLIGDFFTDNNTGYLCGAGGALYKTTNGGTSFTTLNSGTTQNLYSVWFIDANTGYVVGDGPTVIKTTDAGATWNPVVNPATDNLRQIYFFNSSTGFMVGGTGNLLKTTDGGSNWSLLNSGTTVGLYSVYFTDINTGFVGGQVYTMLKTTDGGSSWNPVNHGVPGGNIVTPFLSIKFTDSQTGYAVGGYAYANSTQNCVIIKTTDGGTSWVEQANPGGTQILASLKFFDSNIGYIVGGDITNNTSLILKTNNGGNTWTLQPTSTYRLTDVFLISTGEGYAVGLNGAFLKGNL